MANGYIRKISRTVYESGSFKEISDASQISL